MRDYKNVTVPRRHRTSSRTRKVNKRAVTGPVRGRKRTGLKHILGVVLGAVITAALCYGAWSGYRWLTSAAIFQIAGVDVKGTRRVTDEEIRDIASAFTGQNVFRVDIGAAARKASANPWVREVRIERKLPNRISMVFTERLPRAVLQASNGRFLMDDEGVAIVPAREGDALASELPVIVVRSLRAASGNPVASEALPAAHELLDELALRGGWDLGDVTIRADSPESIAVLYRGREFRVGTGNYGEKLRRLGEIVSDMNRRGQDYSYIDLRPERQAAVMIVTPGRGARDRGQGPKQRS
jgi:cell division septal protein FtsQ